MKKVKKYLLLAIYLLTLMEPRQRTLKTGISSNVVFFFLFLFIVFPCLLQLQCRVGKRVLCNNMEAFIKTTEEELII